MFSVMKCNFACDTNWRNTLLVPWKVEVMFLLHTSDK